MLRTTPPVLIVVLAVAVAVVSLASQPARAMCGCMLRPQPKLGESKGAKIINKSSKVILARDDDKNSTTMTIANDFEGAPAEFGMVIPVPSAVQKEDVKVVDDKVFDALETSTAPTVTEVIEPECNSAGGGIGSMEKSAAPMVATSDGAGRLRAADYGVKVESHFFAGEYEMAVLSGKNADGLVQWLQKFHYDVPDDAKAVFDGYIKQKMMFFLARVYVKEMGNGRRHLRPIQVHYTTPKLMLPIRLGMVNADGPQEILLFALSPKGRIESTNYRSVPMPTGAALPWFAKDQWNDVYGAVFDDQERREDQRVLFLEAAQTAPGNADTVKAGARWSTSLPTTVTRLHFRYADAGFPEDLVLQTTADITPFRVNMSATRPARSPCNPSMSSQARSREQQTLANLTGWPMEKVLAKVGGVVESKEPKWYDQLWK